MKTLFESPLRTWAQVAALLAEAAARGLADDVDPATHSLTLGAELVACQAAELLSREMYLVGETHLDAQVHNWSAAELIRAAEGASRRHPIEEFPVGASGVIVALGDLMHEVGA